jgi:N-acyl-L-homoserine lactone synthetase
MVVALAGGQEVAMNAEHAIEIGTETRTDEEALFAEMLRGFRFRVCDHHESVARALAVRRAVYVDEAGYDIPVPDQYDFWSWLLIAEDVETGEVVGTLRLTPRAEGPLEADEYFRLPARLRSTRTLEMNRFAILPAYRKGKTFLPVVSMGLFKLAKQVAQETGMDWVVICSKAERTWTYCWLGAERTGMSGRYGKLNDAEHEVLTIDVCRADETFATNPLAPFFVGMTHAEIEMPDAMPPVGLVDPDLAEGLFLRKSA